MEVAALANNNSARRINGLTHSTQPNLAGWLRTPDPLAQVKEHATISSTQKVGKRGLGNRGCAERCTGSKLHHGMGRWVPNRDRLHIRIFPRTVPKYACAILPCRRVCSAQRKSAALPRARLWT